LPDMKQCIKLAFFLLFGTSSFAQSSPSLQGEKWDLRKCVEYAMQNNISVRQADLQIRFAELELQQSKLSQQPNVNFTSSLGYSAGNNQDPTTFSLITTGYIFNNYSLQANLDLFNWFTKKNSIAARDLSLKVTQTSVEKAKNDVALNVAVAYLQILLAREQITLAKIKVDQTKSQLESTRRQVEAGKLPELNAVNLESRLAAYGACLLGSDSPASQSFMP